MIKLFARPCQDNLNIVFVEGVKLILGTLYKLKKSPYQYAISKESLFEIQYKNGKENGLSVLFYPDGKLREKGTYKNGERDGKWQQFDEAGVFVKEVIYKNGVEELLK